jgi:tetraacyldisaccharide 4'-kinase
MKQFSMQFDAKYWYRPRLTMLTAALLPLSWLFGVGAAARRWCYRHGLIKSYRFDLPVIVVGNLTVGGTGKTPCVLALAKYLTTHGYHPGIVSRGVGGCYHVTPCLVRHDSSVAEVGDEAVLLARNSQCPVVICIDRVAAVNALLSHFPDCDVVICDDGLQHYRLNRFIEIAIIDGLRYFGNGRLLPAGPLREPCSRLANVDFAVINGGALNGAYQMTIEPKELVSVKDKSCRAPIGSLQAGMVHAVAGIGHPDKFFNLLRANGYEIIEHVFPDHHPFISSNLDFGDALPILMTEKDAVKCEKFADNRMWYLDVSATLDTKLLNGVIDKLREMQQA